MSVDFDEIRKYVAIKHNVLLDKDDPILVTVSISEMVLDNYLKLVSSQYEQANKSLTISLEQQVEQSKETAGKVITSASSYVSDQLKKTVDSLMTDVHNNLNIEIKKVTDCSHLSSKNAERAQIAKTISFYAAIVASSAAIISVVALVVILIKI